MLQSNNLIKTLPKRYVFQLKAACATTYLLQQHYYCDCVIMIYIYLYYPRPGLSDQLFELNGSLLPMRLTFF
jgi:hypothetical protein